MTGSASVSSVSDAKAVAEHTVTVHKCAGAFVTCGGSRWQARSM